MMISIYHRQRIVRAARRQKRVVVTDPMRRCCRHRPGTVRFAALLAVLVLGGCDPVEVVEGSDTHVSVRYDGIVNGLDQATELARSACAAHGKTAKLRKTYYEGLGAGERFAFFDCV